MKCLLVGDVHGDIHFLDAVYDTAQYLKVDRIIQLGDLGWAWPSSGGRVAKCIIRNYEETGIPFWFLAGNHDNWDFLPDDELAPEDRDREGSPEPCELSGPDGCREAITYLPRGCRFTIGSTVFGALGGAYCVHPKTKVLTTDFLWVDAGELGVDDRLIGFDEVLWSGPGKNTALKESRVESTGRNILPTYRIITDKGSTIVSGEHLMVQRPARGKKRQWLAAQNIHPGDHLQWLVEPWETESSRDSGWLAGIYDGEGWIDNYRVAFAQNPGSVLNEALHLLQERGYDTSTARSSKKCNVQRVDVRGGKWVALKLLGTLRPVRLLENARPLWEGKEIIGKGKETPVGKGWAKVRSIQYIGLQEVVTLKTSTKTFIADGFLAHNSIDKQNRLDRGGHTWWPQESPPPFTAERLIAGGPLDVLLTHDAPLNVQEFAHYQDGSSHWIESYPTRRLIQDIIDACAPDSCFHGHHHVRYDEVIYSAFGENRDCHVHGLGHGQGPFHQAITFLDVE